MDIAGYLPIPKYWRRLLIGAAAFYAAKHFGIIFPVQEKKLVGDVAVITGGGSGIGRLMGLRLARLGCRVALLDVNLDGAQKVANEIQASGGEARAYKCDVGNPSMVHQVRDAVLSDFGRCDILINNAGIVSGDKLLDETDQRTDLTLRINTLAPMLMVKAFLPGMLQRRKGHIVTIASNAGRIGVNGMVSYCASKFGAVGMNESLRGELNDMCPEIKTTCVCPSYIDTGMFTGAQMRSTIPALNPIVNALMPVLSPDYVVDQIVAAIKRNQAVLVMPKFALLTDLIRATCSTEVQDWLAGVSGVSQSMSKFEQTRKV